MKRTMLPVAAILAATLAAPAFASDVKSDRGYSDLKSYQVVIDATTSAKTTTAQGQTLSTQNTRPRGFDAGFGVLQGQFEPGRR